MLKPSDIPTDNLYKFKAIIFSILLAITIFLMARIIMLEENPEEIKAAISLYANRGQIDEINNQVAEIDSLNIKSLNKGDSTFINLGTNDSVNSQKLWDWKLELLKKKFDLNQEQFVNSATMDKYFERVDINMTIYYVVLLIALAFFMYWTLTSFIEWKDYLQIYQDAILMKQAGVSKEKIVKHLEKTEKKITKKERGFFRRLFGRNKDSEVPEFEEQKNETES